MDLEHDRIECRKETDLVTWCQSNNLFLNINKTKKLVIDFKKEVGVHTSVCINAAEVEMAESFRFLGMNITNNLSGTTNEAMAKEAH